MIERHYNSAHTNSSTSLTELNQLTWRITEKNNGRSLYRWFNYWRRQNNRCINSKRHSYTNIQKSRICLAQVALKFFWTGRKKIQNKVQLNKLMRNNNRVSNWQDKMLRIKWDKKEVLLNIVIPSEIQEIIKWHILQKLNSIYDVLAFVSPCTLVAKDVFCKICDKKIPLDKELLPEITNI